MNITIEFENTFLEGTERKGEGGVTLGRGLRTVMTPLACVIPVLNSGSSLTCVHEYMEIVYILLYTCTKKGKMYR